MNITEYTPAQLRQAADLKKKIEALEKQLGQILGSTAKPATAKAPKKKGGMSAAGRAKVAAAQKARWAKVKAAKSVVAPVTKPAAKSVPAAKPTKKKYTMSAAAKAKLSALAKARWAKIHASAKKKL